MTGTIRNCQCLSCFEEVKLEWYLNFKIDLIEYYNTAQVLSNDFCRTY